MRFDWAAVSHPGRVRAGNEDAAVAEEGLFAVADGMGGHAGGEVASQVALEALRAGIGAGLVDAARAANRAVIDRAGADPALRGMGTTLCAMAVVTGAAPTVEVVNVGDSRAYLLRDGDLSQITEDHNLVAQLEREGRITAEEARVHPQRNIITRVLGNDPDVEVDTFPIDPYRGDRFLLCSDGLFNEVTPDAIADVLRHRREPQAAADELVRRALDGGGRDNITVVVVDVLDDDDKARRASAALAGSAATSTARPIHPADPTLTGAQPAVAGGRPAPERPASRRMTWRTGLFAVALVAVVAVAAGSVWWFGRKTLYVGVDGDRVAIFRGRPGGVLWIDPTVEERTGVRFDDVIPARKDDVTAGEEQPDLRSARRYVTNLTTTTTSTTTSTTTTTVVPATPTTPAPATSAP